MPFKWSLSGTGVLARTLHPHLPARQAQGRRSHQARLRSIQRAEDGNLLPAGADGGSFQAAANVVEERAHQFAQPAADHDHLGLQQINDVAQPDGEVVGGFAQNFVGQGVAIQGRPAHDSEVMAAVLPSASSRMRVRGL